MASTVAPTIKLYSSIICPGSHRVKIVLDQLGLPYTNEDIDLGKPRSSDYLRVNPRGQTPTLEYNGSILRESAPIVWFLADSHPGPLAAPSNASGAALLRHRIAFLESTWSLYVWEPLSKGWMQVSDEAGVPFVESAMEGIVKEVQPLLADARPYFAGSETLTLAEVLIAPTLIQMQSFTPRKYLDELRRTAPKFYSWSQLLLRNEALTKYFDEEQYMAMARALQDKIRGGAKTGNRGVDRLTE